VGFKNLGMCALSKSVILCDFVKHLIIVENQAQVCD